MRCLVTGGAGFIGSHLARWLIARNHEVAVFDNHIRPSMLEASVPSEVVRLRGDVRDVRALQRAICGCEVVFHLAAQSQVMAAERDPEYCFTTNVVGTFNVLQVARESGVSRVVFASSREVYGEAIHLPVEETQPPNPKNTYGASKAAAEAYCRAVEPQERMTVVTLRLANVYGPGDAGRLVPLWMERALAGADIEIFGGRQVLDMVWIDSVVQAFGAAAQPEIGSMVINVGSGQGTLIDDIASRILDVTHSRSRVIMRPARRQEVERYVADVRRMRDILGVVPPTDPLAGIASMTKAHMRRRPEFLPARTPV